MTIFKNTFFLSVLVLVFGFSSIALGQGQQPPNPAQRGPEPIEPSSITDDEIEKIVTITSSMDSIQKESEKKVKKIVDDSDMEFARFEEIAQASRNPQAAQNLNMTEEEQQIISEIQPKLMKVNREAQQNFMTLIEEKGLTTKRFQQIMQASQQHQEVAKRIEETRKDMDS